MSSCPYNVCTRCLMADWKVSEFTGRDGLENQHTLRFFRTFSSIRTTLPFTKKKQFPRIHVPKYFKRTMNRHFFETPHRNLRHAVRRKHQKHSKTWYSRLAGTTTETSQLVLLTFLQSFCFLSSIQLLLGILFCKISKLEVMEEIISTRPKEKV